MTWADFYLICFAGGFFFSLLSFLAGGMRWHLHLPHFSHVHVATPPCWRAGHGAPAGHAPATATGGDCDTHGHAVQISPFNFITADRVPGLVRRGRVSADALLRRLVCDRAWPGRGQRSGGRNDCVSFPQPRADLSGRKHGPRRLRNDRRAGPSLGLDPGEWHGRNHLLAGGHAADLRRPRRRWSALWRREPK